MSRVDNRLRWIRQLCSRRGFEVDSVERKGNGHFACALHNDRGEKYIATFAATPSCPRSDLNSLQSKQLRKVTP